MAYLNSIKVTVYTSSNTWTKDSRTKFVKVYGFQGGGGGGSGRKGLTTAAGGGGGGSGGVGFVLEGPSSIFGDSETVTVGALAAGGATQSGDGMNGNNGTTANLSKFGSFSAPATVAAGGGVTTAVAGGSSVAVIVSSFTSVAMNTTGGTGRNNAGSAPAVTAGGTIGKFLTGTGGGGGGGYDLVVPRVGGVGADSLNIDASVLIAGGIAGTESGVINGGDGNPALTSGGFFTGGTGGGGGGGPSAGTTSGNGGAGAIPGGGGGGGGGGISTVANSGTGGSGARGQVTVIEFF